MGTSALNSEAIIVPKRGGPARLELKTVSVPAPGPGQIRVRMLAAGVAFADLMIREGVYPIELPWPRTPGYDIVGEIEAIGPGVPSELSVGSRVASLTVHGSYARHRLLSADQCVPVPDSVDPAQAVALVLNYLTAWQMLHRVARVQAGDTVFIHAASGGVGTAVLELARIAGIRIIGICSASKHDQVRALGGIPIDYRNEDVEARVRDLTEGRGVDAVLDSIGGAETKRSWRLVRPTGVVVCFGALSIASNGRLSLPSAVKAMLGSPRFTPLGLLTDVKGAIGYNVDHWRMNRPEAYREDLAHVVKLLADGQINPLIAERVPLAEARRGQELLGSGKTQGKVVLV
jgi:NADPH:quinone reductase-like Zn-dependent oxidoreductase